MDRLLSAKARARQWIKAFEALFKWYTAPHRCRIVYSQLDLRLSYMNGHIPSMMTAVSGCYVRAIPDSSSAAKQSEESRTRVMSAPE
eukprot:5084873-Pyramimonas_sp.AAC.1